MYRGQKGENMSYERLLNGEQLNKKYGQRKVERYSQSKAKLQRKTELKMRLQQKIYIDLRKVFKQGKN